MGDDLLENEPTRPRWAGFWCMIVQQTQNSFYDKMAQFTVIALGVALAFSMTILGMEVDMLSAAGLMVALPMVVFAPLAGWVSDRFSKRDVMLTASVVQALVLAGICGAVVMKNTSLLLCGFFALAGQGAFFSPAKIGINKELVGSRHLGFSSAVQQMTATLAILAGQIPAGWIFDPRFTRQAEGIEIAWEMSLAPLVFLAVSSIPGLAVAWAVPRVPAQGGPKFSATLAVSHFVNLADLWRDVPLRRASFGIALFWGFATYIHLWSVKVAKGLTGGGGDFPAISSVLMLAALLGMATGFGFASFLLRKRIELGWVPAAGIAMTLSAASLAIIPPGGWAFLITLGLLAFAGAVFLAPLTAWVQDRYPAAKRGRLQSAVNLQNCIAGIIAVLLIRTFETGVEVFEISPAIDLRLEIAFIAMVCGLMTLSVLRLLPGDFIRLVGGGIIRSIYRIQVVNPDRIPAKGGALLLPNHVTFADGLFISAACPRPVRFVMDEAFMAKRSIRLFVSIFDTVTIRRDQPREAIRITIGALKKGDLVCLFPEGQLTRTGTLNELKRGFELIARKAGHPLIPMWCDGSWGSIFSFERGRFFRKLPYRLPYGMAVAFGREIRSEEADLEAVRQGLLLASAEATGKRFEAPGWATRIPRGKNAALLEFKTCDKARCRRIWVNGHQIGQVSGLQRHQPFHVLKGDPCLPDLAGVLLTFCELFGAEPKAHDSVNGNVAASWVGGDRLRHELGHTQLSTELVFYDFGPNALDPIFRAGLLHCPCLAVDGIVIAMSMPHPGKPNGDSDDQSGHKLGTWGKLLPGWFLLPSGESGFRVYGPAAPEEGLPLPIKCFLDAEGYLSCRK